MEVQEDAKVGSVVGIVTARDPDVTNKPVRFVNYIALSENNSKQFFHINIKNILCKQVYFKKITVTHRK